jgi:DNA mismatch repair protein MutL
MGRIRTLTESTINQIAAGEVIENPASVIKELVENSLDAGAKKIRVEIQGGGFGQIIVSDDGIGMNRDDALLSFERHATSKITQLEDLNTLSSMGFRGEALASIAAVSKVELVTAEEGKDGVRVEIQAGKIVSCTLSPRSRGTTISVQSLFYNTPARKKFQKSASASIASIHKLLFSLALSYPEVGFELFSASEPLLSVFPEKDSSFLTCFERRIKAVFKTSFLQSRKPLCLEKNGYQIHGFLAPPVDDRINRSGQYLFINRRAIQSPLISAAVKAGYGHRLDARRYPIFALHIVAPPDLLDVNVHPQKREVRFQDETWIKEFIQSSVQLVFHSFSPLPPISTTPFQFQEAPLTLRETQEIKSPSLIEDPEVVGLYGPYLLLAEDSGVMIVNLRKIQEKTLQKELSIGSKSQGLLLPIPLTLSRQQMIDLEERKPLLQKLGFSIERSGKENFLIHALPCCLKSADAQEAIELVLEGHDSLNQFVKFAVRGKKQFLLKEALALWHQIKDRSDPEFIVKVGFDEIEKLFR